MTGNRDPWRPNPNELHLLEGDLVASRLRISSNAVRHLIETAQLPSVHRSGRDWIPEDAVELIESDLRVLGSIPADLG